MKQILQEVLDYFGRFKAPKVISSTPHPLMANVDAYAAASSGALSDPGLGFKPINRRLLEAHGDTLFPDERLYIKDQRQFLNGYLPNVSFISKQLETKHVPDYVDGLPPEKMKALEEEIYAYLIAGINKELSDMFAEHSWKRETVHPFIPVMTSTLVNPDTFEPYLSFRSYYGVSHRRK
jgi:hypothetical protein